ncbi:Ubiquinone/menaquinone biosynthesis C-methylase UbiE [Microbacterium sp. cf046]|uniref:class I SAM-dependent methyltransferase n=1 Tax=Microbacterium sp. cf046 TaxID=1761803 RepID=UPI0008E35CEB|nr:methyltransferase domain-containing protein [Microbacterium sp. cf046]SFS03859.1 Ubiquinone/menaquinone biosynthesis C-methylase UbiE [Microbacterium sp. cf046]
MTDGGTYTLPHDLPGEDERLTLMSEMLDPQLFFRLTQAGVAEGWRCLEVGAGNGSVSRWLSGQVGPAGSVLTSDLDIDLLKKIDLPNVTVRKIDVTTGDLGSGYDLVVARALLHHLPERHAVVARLADAVRPGGVIVLEEPDFHPVLATDSPTLKEFWKGWLVWADRHQIDYFVGRKLPAMLVAEGFDEVRAYGETILYRGDSLTARYLEATMRELHESLQASGFIAESVWSDAMTLFRNDGFWSWQNSYVTSIGRKSPTRQPA